MSTSTGCPTLSLRPETPEDDQFRFELYASTRKEELDHLDWPEEMKVRFLEMQFKTQQGYRTDFPQAEFQIVMAEGQRAGRLILNRAADEWRLVDIALLSERRNSGIGTALIQNLQKEAAAAEKPLRLTVLKGHRAARLYRRLGFVKIGDSEVHEEMEWRRPVSPEPQVTLHASQP